MAKIILCGAYPISSAIEGVATIKKMKTNKNVFVVKHGDTWATRSAGNQRVTKTFETQKAAIEAGREQAIKNNSELTVQNKHGQFREKNSYGNDPKNING